MTFRKGLSFNKFDLHVHTSASTDYKGDGDPGKVVAAALDRGLAGIAVTDHQTADSID